VAPTGGLMIGGAVLTLLGVLGLAVPEFATHDTKDVASIGGFRIQTVAVTPHAVPAVLSGGALAVGIVLVGAGLYRRI